MSQKSYNLEVNFYKHTALRHRKKLQRSRKRNSILFLAKNSMILNKINTYDATKDDWNVT